MLQVDAIANANALNAAGGEIHYGQKDEAEVVAAFMEESGLGEMIAAADKFIAGDAIDVAPLDRLQALAQELREETRDDD